MAWAEGAESADGEIFEIEDHRREIAGRKVRLWPHFAAITTRAPAWLVLQMARRYRPRPVSSAGFGPNLHLIRWGKMMLDFQDLFQWDRFITPTIIKTFYWLVIALICLLGVSGIFAGLAAMAISPFGGFLVLLESIASVIVGIVFSRIVAEFILIVFRINEHLGAIRDRGGMR